MDKQATVLFRNVGQYYFPQTRVECHCSLSAAHHWSSSDWIGIFQVGWTSVKEYYTYTWVNVPENYTKGTSVDCCALFHAFYLPRPSSVEYEFVYVDQTGQVCGRSRAFTFCAPKPLEELETLREEREEEDGEEELMLVIPRAQLLQSRLEECLKAQDGLQKAMDVSMKERDEERERNTKDKLQWDSERAALKKETSELRDTIKQYTDMLQRMEGKHKDVKYSQENLSSELSKLLAEKVESLQKIKELEDDVRVLSEREKEGNAEMERLKERVKKMTGQMKHEEEKRKSLQTENEAVVLELRSLQERLDSSEHLCEGLRRDLREMTSRHSLLHTELQQARLQGAQLSLQLSQDQLQLREERATWALEREGYRQAAETDKNKLQELYSELRRTEDWLQDERAERERLERERDSIRVQQRELQELKSALRKTQKETEEEQQQEKQQILLQDSEERMEPCTEDAAYSDDEDASSSPSSSSPSSSPLLVSSELGRPEASTAEEEQELFASAKENLNVPKLIEPVPSELCDSSVW